MKKVWPSSRSQMGYILFALVQEHFGSHGAAALRERGFMPSTTPLSRSCSY